MNATTLLKTRFVSTPEFEQALLRLVTLGTVLVLVVVLFNGRTNATTIAFFAAFPSFPLGDWPLWDVRIPLAGAFVEKQIAPHNFEERASEHTIEDLLRHREELWEDFCTVVKIVYPFPIFYCETPRESV